MRNKVHPAIKLVDQGKPIQKCITTLGKAADAAIDAANLLDPLAP